MSIFEELDLTVIEEIVLHILNNAPEGEVRFMNALALTDEFIYGAGETAEEATQDRADFYEVFLSALESLVAKEMVEFEAVPFNIVYFITERGRGELRLSAATLSIN